MALRGVSPEWHSRPQAAFSAPRRARSAGKAALAPPVRAAAQIAGPRRGKAAGRRARPGLAARSGEGRGPATPGGECAGRAARHGLRRRRGRAGKAGRSAADRAGGADGPTAPTSWGPGRPGAPTPQPARGRSGARPRGARTEGAWPCGAEGCPRATERPNLTGPGPVGARPWAAHYPDCRRQAGRAAAPPPHRVGRGAARRPRGRVGRALPKGARTGAPFPWPLSGRENEKRECPSGTPSCLLIKAIRSAVVKSNTCPRPRLAKSLLSDSSSIAGRQHRGSAPVPRVYGISGASRV